MSRYYFESPSFGAKGTGDDGDVDFTLTLDDEDNLPYPLPLQRDAFLKQGFSPQEYLSSLNVRTRHQTLEDLRAELRTRSQDLSKELLDLVNANYQDFLGLGGSLKGGEEKVEEVRVGLLGFQRGIGEIRQVVEERRQEVDILVTEREKLWTQRQLARSLLDLDRRISELEERLLVDSAGKNGPDAAMNGAIEEEDSSDEDEDAEDDDAQDDQHGLNSSLRKLKRHVSLYLCLQEVISRIGPEHPFVKTQSVRTIKVRNTILLDLGAALKEAKLAGNKGKDRVVKLLVLYSDLEEYGAALSVAKS